MTAELFGAMKIYVGFGKADAAALADLSAPLQAHLPEIVDRFYGVLLSDPQARKIIDSDGTNIENLRRTLLRWLSELFSGQYDEAYFENRCKIGRVHIRVNLPQHFMFIAMNVIRLALVERIDRLRLENASSKIAAVHKILDLELAIMNETYREDLIDHVRQMEHSQYEAKLSESAHLATVGRLAASLAHEIKNPLAGISGAIQVLGSGLAEDHPHREVMTEVLHQIDRLDAAVKDLLIYARPKLPERARIDLGMTLDRVMILLREEPAFRKVKVSCCGQHDDFIIEVDESQIQQVISNLMLNAAHACENGGRVDCSVLRENSRIRICIKDDGVGIPPLVLDRVFEPFFTTKAKGTGLGLPICKRIIEAHGGRLDIRSEVGKGTHVTIDLPAET